MSTLSATGLRSGSAKGSTRCFVPIPWRSSAPSAWPTISTRATAPRPATISTASSIAARRSRSDADKRWRVKPRLDAEAMHAAALVLLGRHDFSTFRDSQCQANSPIRTLDRVDVRRDGDDVLFEASARSFLHRQVRSMVGTLVEVGAGRWSADAPQGGVRGRRPQPLRPGRPASRPLSRPRRLFRSTERNKARARARRCATAPRDRRPRPARRRAWMVALTRPSSTTGQAFLMKRASEVPPPVESEGLRPVTSVTASATRSVNGPGLVRKATALLGSKVSVARPPTSAAATRRAISAERESGVQDR